MQLHLVEDDASPCSRTMYQQCSSQPLSHGLLYVLPQIHATWSRMGNRIYRASLVPRHTVKLPFSVLVVLRSRGCVVASCWLVRSIVAVLEEVDRHATDMRNGAASEVTMLVRLSPDSVAAYFVRVVFVCMKYLFEIRFHTCMRQITVYAATILRRVAAASRSVG